MQPLILKLNAMMNLKEQIKACETLITLYSGQFEEDETSKDLIAVKRYLVQKSLLPCSALCQFSSCIMAHNIGSLHTAFESVFTGHMTHPDAERIDHFICSLSKCGALRRSSLPDASLVD